MDLDSGWAGYGFSYWKTGTMYRRWAVFGSMRSCVVKDLSVLMLMFERSCYLL